MPKIDLSKVTRYENIFEEQVKNQFLGMIVDQGVKFAAQFVKDVDNGSKPLPKNLLVSREKFIEIGSRTVEECFHLVNTAERIN